MNKKWLKLALGIFCVVFVYFVFFHKATDPDDYCAKIDKITNAFIVDMCKKHELIYCGQGGSCMDNIKKISVSFDQKQQIDITEARVLLVNCVEEFLTRVNADEDVRPFLVQYPFTNENVHISIGFVEPKEDVDLQNIVHAFNSQDRAVYSIYDREHDRYKPKLKEPYEEALKIVKESGKLDIDMHEEREDSSHVEFLESHSRNPLSEHSFMGKTNQEALDQSCKDIIKSMG